MAEKTMKGLSQKALPELWTKYLMDGYPDIDINSIPKDKEDTEIIDWLVDNDIAIVHPAEGRALYQYARMVKGNILEIGTARCGSTTILGISDRENSDRVYSIDLVGTPHNAGLIKAFGLKCRLIISDSLKAAEDWRTNFDMIFFDGNHSEAHVYNELVAWTPFLNKGGYMLFHDYPKPKTLQRWRKRKRFVGDRIDSLNDVAQVYNAVSRFLRENTGYQIISQTNKLFAVQKV